MNKLTYNLLLADDDDDDCDFFKDALDDLPLSAVLTTVNNGVELMEFLLKKSLANLPDILFLDLNMPRKNGYECLQEMKMISELKDLPVIIFSTSLDSSVVDSLYEKGAIHYIRKPGDFSKLKKVILEALTVAFQNNYKQPARANFIIQS